MNGFLCPKGFICFNLNIILLVIILIILIFVVLSIRFGGLPNNNLTEKIDTLLDKQNKKIKSIEKQDNESIETQVIVSPPVAINNRVELNDPLRPPLRQNHNFVGVPINIPTRGEYVNYQQVGILKIIQVIINYYHCMENQIIQDQANGNIIQKQINTIL